MIKPLKVLREDEAEKLWCPLTASENGRRPNCLSVKCAFWISSENTDKDELGRELVYGYCSQVQPSLIIIGDNNDIKF